jgi:hypothetical protein
VKYGIHHEADGVTCYEQLKQTKVERTGIHMLPCGFIGASPDGLVAENKIIEVKCAFSLRKMQFDEALKSNNCIFCYQSGSDLVLKAIHDYYHQIQGILHITGRDACDLIYWTKKWQKVVQVRVDPDWKGNIDLLKMFYTEHLLPFLLKDTAAKSA